VKTRKVFEYPFVAGMYICVSDAVAESAAGVAGVERLRLDAREA
jgi:hypothetical protein